MRPLAALACFAAAAFALALALGGGAPFGRLLTAAGAPGLAAFAFDDPAWRGVANFRAGDMEAAAADFAAAGDDYNRGVALARAGRFAAALEAFDLAAHRGDEDARANFELVAAHYAGLAVDPEAFAAFPKREEGPEAEGSVAEGDGRAAGTGDEATNATTMMGAPELTSRGRLGVRRVFDDAFMVADERWLNQLSDAPGAFLAARIRHERKRRARLGLAPPEPEDPR